MSASAAIKFVPPTLDRKGTLTLKEAEVFSEILKKETGIHLEESKMPMIEARLYKRLAELKLQNFKDYIEYLRSNSKERVHFVNALTTNKTDFFREPDHFDFLKNVFLPDFVKNSQTRKLRIWSAASSTGEEVYTLAIVLAEFFQNSHSFDYKLVASDVDTEVIAKAEKGVYRRDVVKPVRIDLIHKYFKQVSDDDDGEYQVRDELKRLVKFKQFNLLKDEFSVPIKFDVVFLRNVLIYFKTETIETVINRIYEKINPGGYLIVGHCEQLATSIQHNFKLARNSIYRKE